MNLTIQELSKLTNINIPTLRIYLAGKHFAGVRTFKIKRNKYFQVTDKHIKMLKLIYLKRTNPDYSYILGGWNTQWKNKMKQYNNELEAINK